MTAEQAHQAFTEGLRVALAFAGLFACILVALCGISATLGLGFLLYHGVLNLHYWLKQFRKPEVPELDEI